MRPVDADNAIDVLEILSEKCGDIRAFEQAIWVIKDVPTIDAVPVVRCKDCKHWDTSWQNDYAPNYHYCLLVDGTRRDDFYCADAERRTDE